MKHFSILEAPSDSFIQRALGRMGWNSQEIAALGHPQEDFLLVSEKYPIFVVADGVTLIQFLLDKERRTYPKPSPAGEAARIFCEAFMREAKRRYTTFTEADLKETFGVANDAVMVFNEKNGRTPSSIDYWDIDYYAATAAFVVIKDSVVYWGSICDSYIVCFDADGRLIFQSPHCDAKKEALAAEYMGDSSDAKEKARHGWRERRNGIDHDGKLTGYGVVTGEDAANRYLNTGVFALQKDETVMLITDGFEDYLRLPEFFSFFKNGLHDVERTFKEFTALKALEDPEKFGRERSLIAVTSDDSGLSERYLNV